MNNNPVVIRAAIIEDEIPARQVYRRTGSEMML